jgi:membrane protein required for colicin V production
LLAVWYYPAVAEYLEQYVLSYLACEILGFAAVLISVTMCCGLLSGIIHRAIDTVGLAPFDRILGAVFGLFRGILIGVALMMTCAVFVPDSPWLRHSQLAPYFLEGAHAVSFVVPPEFSQKIAKGAALLLQEGPTKIRLESVPLSLGPR